MSEMTDKNPAWTDSELAAAITAVEREHLCGCETCMMSSATCPPIAATLILELAELRLAVSQYKNTLAGITDPAEWRRKVERLSAAIVTWRDASTAESLRDGLLDNVFSAADTLAALTAKEL